MVFWRGEILIQFIWKDCLNYKKMAVRNITLSDFRDHFVPLFKDVKFRKSN